MASSASEPTLQDFESLVRSNACDGFCLFADQLSSAILKLLEHTGIPFVVLGDPGDEDVPQVDIDNISYAYQSVRWLSEQGHCQIAFTEFADPVAGVNKPFHRKLRDGYFAAMKEFCGGYHPSWAPTRRTGSVDEKLSYVRGSNPVTAVIVPGLLDAISWEAAFRSNGLRVPEDVALLCHISSMEAGYLEPGLAYHAHDLRAMGARAGEMLIDWIESGTDSSCRVLMPTEPPCWRVSDQQADLIKLRVGAPRSE